MSPQVNDSSVFNRIRAGVYLAPSLPADLFEAILDYLKTNLNLQYTSLIYESSEKNTIAQIENHEVDLAWVSYQKYFELVEVKKICHLLPVGSVHLHSKLSQTLDGDTGFYSDVVIHSSLKSKVKEFLNLRGHRWAYTSPESYSGHGIGIDRLKTMGESATFFGDYVNSKSHIHSLNLVLERKCDATAVDSNVLRLFLEQNPHFKKDLHVFTSWGPLPPYPIVINSHVGAEAQELIVHTLLGMHQTADGIALLNKYGIVKFGNNSSLNYSFLTGQYVKKSTRNGTSNGPADGKQLRTKMINLTKDRFASPYY